MSSSSSSSGSSEEPSDLSAEKMRTLEDSDEKDTERGGKRKKQRKNEALNISSRYDTEDSDVTIVSSDQVHFKVHSFMLKRAS